MKFATIVLLGTLLLGSFASLKAADSAGFSEVAFAFTGRSVENANPSALPSAAPYTCFWFLPMVKGLDQASLFRGATAESNATLTWVSDYFVQPPISNGAYTLMLIPAGTATIYYTANPSGRKSNDPNTYKGDAVATFTRKEALYVAGATGGIFTFSADLVWSKTFIMNGKPFNFKDLVPNGMTCMENGADGAEAGSCVAIGTR